MICTIVHRTGSIAAACLSFAAVTAWILSRVDIQANVLVVVPDLEKLDRGRINIDRGMLGKAATVPLDDLLDAAACAGTASRKDAVALPDPPEPRDGLAVAIWY